MLVLLWCFLWVKIEFSPRFYLTDIVWRVSMSVAWKVTPFKHRASFNPALLAGRLRSQLGPKMVNVRKGVVLPESHKWEGATQGSESGGGGGVGYYRTGQSHTHLSTPVFLFKLIASDRKCPPRFPWKRLFLVGEKASGLLIKQEDRTEYAVMRWLRKLPPVASSSPFPLDIAIKPTLFLCLEFSKYFILSRICGEKKGSPNFSFFFTF